LFIKVFLHGCIQGQIKGGAKGAIAPGPRCKGASVMKFMCLK